MLYISRLSQQESSYSPCTFVVITRHRLFLGKILDNEKVTIINELINDYIRLEDVDPGNESLPKHREGQTKSGNETRSILRLQRRSHSGLPTVPAAKAVRFDDVNLEYVKHFSIVDQPNSLRLEINASNNGPISRFRGGLADTLVNVQSGTPWRHAQPAQSGRERLVRGNKLLLDSVALSSLEYHKYVVCRFAIDGRETISVMCGQSDAYADMTDVPMGYNYFEFNMDFTGVSNLEVKPILSCVRYRARSPAYWDRIGTANFGSNHYDREESPDSGKSLQLDHESSSRALDANHFGRGDHNDVEIR